MAQRSVAAREGRATRREPWIAVVGVATALLLGAFALGPWGDAAAARERALRDHERLAASNLRAAWGALVASGELVAPLGTRYRWRADEVARPARPQARPVRASTAGGSRGFATRLATADVLEVYDTDADAALDQVLAALDEPDASANQRALGRLRAIQLAARAGRLDLVRGQWSAAASELRGDETSDGLPVLLACGLAAARALPEEEGCAIARLLSQAWGEGRLALADEAPLVVPGEGDGPPVVTERPTLAAVARRLESLAPRGDDCLDQRFDARRARWLSVGLADAIGGLPEPLQPDRWHLSATAAGPFAVRGTTTGEREGVFVDPHGVGEALVARVARDDERDAWRIETSKGDLVGADAFLGGWLRVTPAADRVPDVVRAAGRNASILRWGMLFAALGIGVASVVTARALARERRLGELKSTFVANVSHELRTPLASILLMAENLEDGRVPDEASRRRYHANIRREAQRLRRLVSDVLDFARLERGAGPRLEREDLALARWWDEVSREALDRAARDGATLEVSADGLDGLDGVHAAADGEALRRVVINLVDNAIKYGGDGGVQCNARVDGAVLQLVVQDRGPGIPSAQRDAVFTPFERLSDEEGPAGTGLGLAICRALVDAHGGTITLQSGEDGRGARFEVRVPTEDGTDGAGAR